VRCTALRPFRSCGRARLDLQTRDCVQAMPPPWSPSDHLDACMLARNLHARLRPSIARADSAHRADRPGDVYAKARNARRNASDAWGTSSRVLPLSFGISRRDSPACKSCERARLTIARVDLAPHLRASRRLAGQSLCERGNLADRVLALRSSYVACVSKRKRRTRAERKESDGARAVRRTDPLGDVVQKT
jgi:hypothetical protein